MAKTTFLDFDTAAGTDGQNVLPGEVWARLLDAVGAPRQPGSEIYEFGVDLAEAGSDGDTVPYRRTFAPVGGMPGVLSVTIEADDLARMGGRRFDVRASGVGVLNDVPASGLIRLRATQADGEPANDAPQRRALDLTERDGVVTAGRVYVPVPGRDGVDGTDGTDGIDGTDGATGATGAQGPAGAAGSQGPAGVAGATGATGPSGVVAATAPVAYDAGTKTVSLVPGTTVGQRLRWDGSAYVAVAGIPPADLTQGGATAGQALVWSGSAWVPGTVATVAPLTLTSTAAGSVPLAVQGATGQTADLQAWRSSVGTVVVAVRVSGDVAATRLVAANGTTGLVRLADNYAAGLGPGIVSAGPDLITGRIGLGASGGALVNPTTHLISAAVGSLEVSRADAGATSLVLRSPDGTRYRVTIANGGALTTTPI